MKHALQNQVWISVHKVFSKWKYFSLFLLIIKILVIHKIYKTTLKRKLKWSEFHSHYSLHRFFKIWYLCLNCGLKPSPLCNHSDSALISLCFCACQYRGDGQAHRPGLLWGLKGVIHEKPWKWQAWNNIYKCERIQGRVCLEGHDSCKRLAWGWHPERAPYDASQMSSWIPLRSDTAAASWNSRNPPYSASVLCPATPFPSHMAYSFLSFWSQLTHHLLPVGFFECG